MNAPAQSPFRGATKINAVVERMTPLASWLFQFRPECKVLTLSARDFEVLQRFPEAAETLHQIVINEGRMYWRGFELRGERPRKISSPRP